MKNKKALAFDIQTDLLLTIEEEILNKCQECRLDIATTFEDARQLMLMFTYNLVIFDTATLTESILVDLTLGRNIPVLVLSNDAMISEALRQFNVFRVKAFLQKKDINNIVHVIKHVFKSKDLPDWKHDLEKVWNFPGLVGPGL